MIAKEDPLGIEALCQVCETEGTRLTLSSPDEEARKCSCWACSNSCGRGTSSNTSSPMIIQGLDHFDCCFVCNQGSRFKTGCPMRFSSSFENKSKGITNITSPSDWLVMCRVRDQTAERTFLPTKRMMRRRSTIKDQYDNTIQPQFKQCTSMSDCGFNGSLRLLMQKIRNGPTDQKRSLIDYKLVRETEQAFKKGASIEVARAWSPGQLFK